MTRAQLLVLAFVAVLIGTSATVGLHDEAKFTAQRQSLPIRRERPNGGRTDGTSEQFIALGVWGDSFDRFVEGVQREEREEARRVAEEAAAAEQRAREIRPVVPRAPSPAPGGVSDATCAGFPDWFPHYIIWRESNCTRGINTGNGYYGAYQTAGFHWFGGICNGLTWTIPAEEDECAWRLSRGGTNFAPWGA